LVLFLYLTQLEPSSEDPRAFYARYCDDLVFAHPDAALVQDADARMRRTLAALGLGEHRRAASSFLNAAGRPSTTWPEARGTSVVPLLGCLVSAKGTVTLDREKRRRLLAELEKRARRTVAALKGRAAGPTVCAVLNRALEPKLSFSQQRSASLLRRAVTDRPDLKQLDHCIARIVMRAVSGDNNVRGFREVSYRTMRGNWRLVSLFHARNLWAGAGRSSGRARRAPTCLAGSRRVACKQSEREERLVTLGTLCSEASPCLRGLPVPVFRAALSRHVGIACAPTHAPQYVSRTGSPDDPRPPGVGRGRHELLVGLLESSGVAWDASRATDGTSAFPGRSEDG
jgi:hypothetical protein